MQESSEVEGLKAVVQHQNLGSGKKSYRLTGGRLHQVWYFETTCGEYVVKLLNPEKISALGIDKYAQFERIAFCFQSRGINAVPALNIKPEWLPEVEKYYFLYPYQPGVVIDGSQMNPARAFNIGILLAKMHQADLSEIEVEIKPHNYAVQIDKWHKSLNKKEIELLDEMRPLMWRLEKINNECAKACSNHQTSKAVISHGDMDLANIIWDKDVPWLIDWEYAGKFDALYDLINSALYASEISPGNFDANLFETLIGGYVNQLALPANCSNETISEAIYLALAGWMRWIDYNWSRLESSRSVEERTLAVQQIAKWTQTVIGVHNNHDNFLSAVDKAKQKYAMESTMVISFWSDTPKNINPDVHSSATILHQSKI